MEISLNSLDELIVLIYSYHFDGFALSAVVIDHVLEGLASGVGKPTQMVDDYMVHRTAITLQYHDSAAICVCIYLLTVPGVTEFAAINNCEFILHLSAHLQGAG